MGKDLYRNRDFIPDFDEIMAETAARSRELAARATMKADLPYGPGRRERMDILFPSNPAKDAPLHMFIHGGYWRSGSKEDHHLVAAPVLEAGGIAAIVTYDLMPGTRLATIVAQARAAAHHLLSLAADLGADPARFTASGHSAGAHLVSYLASTGAEEATRPNLPDVKGMLLVSGIYDLAGIPGSFLKDETKMRPDEAAAWSPLTATQHAGPLRIITRGERETLPFHDQAQRLAERLTSDAQACETRNETGLNHLTVVLDLADARRPLGQRLADLVASR
jgi:arylformamidase